MNVKQFLLQEFKEGRNEFVLAKEKVDGSIEMVAVHIYDVIEEDNNILKIYGKDREKLSGLLLLKL